MEQKESFRKANLDLQAQAVEIQKKEREDEKKIEEYGHKKAALDQLKKDREE